MTRRYTQWLVIVVCGLYPVTSLSSGQHQRNFTVQLALIAGDSRILLTENLPPQKRLWISERLTAEMNMLPLLSRYSSEETGKKDIELSKKINELLRNRGHLKIIAPLAASLTQIYPVKFPYKLTQVLSGRAEKKASELYDSLCFGCHVSTSPEKSVIIGTLHQFSLSMTREEWLARLLTGLHGDSFTSYENPFTDTQIAILFGHIRYNIK